MNQFYPIMIRQVQFTLSRTFTAGSSVEINGQPLMFELSDEFEFSEEASLDIDIMFCSTNRYAFSLGQFVPHWFMGDVIRICSDGLPAGYTKLYREKDNTYL